MSKITFFTNSRAIILPWSNFSSISWIVAPIGKLFIIENIVLEDKTRKLDYIFFSYHCDISKKLKKGIKDLSILWDIYKLDGYNKYNTIIIDDNPDVKKTGYCIQVPEFNFFDTGSEKDDYLDKLIDILEYYKQFPDDQQFTY